ncbi:MAG: ABC transporter ATP-binding protein [Acidobacteriota bacterium]|nr:ABC transporter ATP-binding protein [Acidobacteriota bacterium]
MPDLRKLIPYILPTAHWLFLGFVLLFVSGGLDGLITVLLKPIFDQLAPEAGTAGAVQTKFDFLQEHLGVGAGSLRQIAFLLVGLSLLKAFLLYFAEYLMSYSGQNVVALLRNRLYGRLLHQSAAFFSDQPTGQLMSRVLNDTERVLEAASKSLTDFLRQVFLLLFFLGLIVYINWVLSVLALLMAPVVLGLAARLGRKMKGVSHESQENLARLSQLLQETLAGQKIVQAFGMENYEKKRFRRSIGDLVHANLKGARLSALASPMVEFLGYASFVPFLFYANRQVQEGLGIGILVVFLAALFRLYEPVRKLSRMHLNFQQAFAASSRIFDLLGSQIGVKDVPAAVEIAPFSRSVAFENVSFRYRQGDVSVLRRINLNLARGEILALAGTSGAGKSTLASLLPRFHDPSAGRISIDGTDIRTVSLHSLRRQIALVPQETFLFDDTIRNNIAYGLPGCGDAQVRRAARMAFIHEFIETLPAGYETRIGERGTRLSGGQRQRVAIARALLKDAPILILDEATSALDAESERLVQEALLNLLRERTAVVIAHRLSTVLLADRIALMEEGRIVDVGGHETLLERSASYRRLHRLQSEPQA